MGWCYAVWVALLCCKPFPCELVSPLGCFGCVFVVSIQHVACECTSHGFDGPQCVFWVMVDETHRNSIRYTCFATKTMSHMAIPTLTPPLSFAMHARTRGFERMFRPCKAQCTYMYDSWMESYTRRAKNHHSSPVWAQHQCCAKTSTLTTPADYTGVCAPPKDQSRSTQYRLIVG